MSKSSVPAFLIKTYDILENPAHFDIISWNTEGTAFIVKNVNEFSEKILPKYFKHNNFSSFVRQLNMYDFHKSKQDSKENEFKHKLFRRGQKYLLSGIKRKGSDQHHLNEGLMMGNRTIELNKAKRNAAIVNDEISTIRSQQEELEKLGKTIYTQNTQLLNENKLLWEELNKNKEKNDKKVEKLMMFVYSIMNNTDKDALTAFNKKMLTNSESNDDPTKAFQNQEQTPSPQSQNTNGMEITPERKNEDKNFPVMNGYLPEKKPEMDYDQMQNKQKSPLFGTPGSAISTLPNTPANSFMIASSGLTPIVNIPPNFQNFPIQNIPIIANTYNTQPYFPDNNNSFNLNNTSTTSGNFFRKENPKLTRPVPSLDMTETSDLKENPVKLFKKSPDVLPQTQPNFQTTPLQSLGSIEDPLKFEDFPFGPSLSRGPSFPGDLRFSRLNSLNVPPVPNSLESNFSQIGFMPFQNSQPNPNGEGFVLNRQNYQNGDGTNYYNPNDFMRNGNGGGLKENGLAGSECL